MDREIAVLDPSAFRDLAWLGQTLTRGEGSITGTTLETTTAPEVNFTDTLIEEGHVINVGGVVLEVVAVTSTESMELSVPRPTIESPVEPPRQLKSVPYSVVTFRTQLEWVHRQVLSMLGLRPGVEATDERLSESVVLNTWELARVEALGALHTIYSAAGALEANDSPNNQRAAVYRRRFQEERQRVVAHIDLNGDGKADAVRRMNVGIVERG
jgi:hypothetical protein